MKEIRLETFTDPDDATWWIENEINNLIYEGHDDIRAELSLIDGVWRAGVITDSRQEEFKFD